MQNEKEYILDGNNFSTLAEFASYFSKLVLVDYKWNGNLNAFNDILRGGFGTPDEGFRLVWRNSDISREKLGYPETIKSLKATLKTCHFSHVDDFRQQLEEAEMGKGSTVFDWLVEIIHNHCEGGEEQEDGVELILK